MNATEPQPPEFWRHQDRTQNDPTNNEIWEDSPFRMAQIHDIRGDGVDFDGESGCQQAMVGEEAFTYEGPQLIGACDDEEPLPWVPDWVGRHCTEELGVTVVGPSHAPVIAERARDWAGIPLAEYRAAESADAFMTQFTEQVLRDDDFGHYCLLESLLFPFRTAADLCYFNLCRGSFVTQCQVPGDGDDRYFDDLVALQPMNPQARRNYWLLYDEYVQTNERWTWERLTASKSDTVMALGQVAEHGLLRLFRKKGASITCHESGATWNPPVLDDDLLWPSVSSEVARPLAYWIERPGRWWDVLGPEGRSWRLLPVFGLQHADREDPGYRRTRRILKPFLNRIA